MSTLRRPKRDDGAMAPATSLNISPGEMNSQDIAAHDDEWGALQKFLSAPATPRTKKKIHFVETPPENIEPRRTNTAPPGFRSSSSTALYQDPVSPGRSDVEELHTKDLISFEESEQVSAEPEQGDVADTSEGKRVDNNNFYQMEPLSTTSFDDSSTPTEELPRGTPDEEASFDNEDPTETPAFPFKQRKSHSISGAWPSAQERAASSRFYRTSSVSGIYAKPSLSPVMKAHIAAAAPTHFDAYATIADDSHDREMIDLDDIPPLSRSHTTSSSNSAYSAWDDRSPDATSEKSRPVSGSPSPSGSGKQQAGTGNEYPLETVKRKLSALTHKKGGHSCRAEKEHTPEQTQTPDEIPVAPPNTRKSSDSPRRGHGGFPARHSRSSGSSPAPTPKIEWSEPQSSASSTHDSPPLKPALKQSQLSKQFGAFKSSDRFGASHRDSLNLAHERMMQKWPMLDPQLSSTRDSIVLAKQRFEKYPKSEVVIDEQTGQVKFGGLSPIKDASPPDAIAFLLARRQEKASVKATRWKREIGGHPENDEDCPICEIERPRAKRLAEMQAAL